MLDYYLGVDKFKECLNVSNNKQTIDVHLQKLVNMYWKMKVYRVRTQFFCNFLKMKFFSKYKRKEEKRHSSSKVYTTTSKRLSIMPNKFFFQKSGSIRCLLSKFAVLSLKIRYWTWIHNKLTTRLWAISEHFLHKKINKQPPFAVKSESLTRSLFV